MKVGVMQPYFLPYIGYWQLMNAVDRYVIYDDVNFINRGWINRNRILLNGHPHYLNVPMSGASQNKKINEIGVNTDRRLAQKSLRLIQAAYRKAPYYAQIYPLVENIICQEESNLAAFVSRSIYKIAGYLDIKTELLVSSQLEKDDSLHGQDKVLDICERLGATEYYNAIGGQKLYDFSAFRARGIALKFLRTQDIVYSQPGASFEPNLSILDVLMYNDKEKVKQFLHAYTLVEENDEGI